MLYNKPPHAVTIYSVTSGTDSGGGTSLTYTSAQSAVSCSINTVSSQEAEAFARREIYVTHTIAFLSSALTVTLQPGYKIIADDTSDVYHVKGIRKGRAYLGIPAFTYVEVEHEF